MSEIDLKAEGSVRAAQMAYYNAANALAILSGKGDSLHWPTFGKPAPGVDNPLDTYMMRLADFVRMSGSWTSGEALYRYAGGKLIHDAAADAYDTLDFEVRAAYHMFAETLPRWDALIKNEIERVIAAVAQAKPVPIAAALKLPVDETTLEMVDDPLAKTELPPAAPFFPAVTDKPAETVAAAPAAPPADPEPVYWINPIAHAVFTGPDQPDGKGWVKVDEDTFDAFAADIHGKADAADEPAADASTDPAADAPTDDASADASDAGAGQKPARRRQSAG